MDIRKGIIDKLIITGSWMRVIHLFWKFRELSVLLIEKQRIMNSFNKKKQLLHIRFNLCNA